MIVEKAFQNAVEQNCAMTYSSLSAEYRNFLANYLAALPEPVEDGLDRAAWDFVKAVAMQLLTGQKAWKMANELCNRKIVSPSKAPDAYAGVDPGQPPPITEHPPSPAPTSESPYDGDDASLATQGIIPTGQPGDKSPLDRIISEPGELWPKTLREHINAISRNNVMVSARDVWRILDALLPLVEAPKREIIEDTELLKANLAEIFDDYATEPQLYKLEEAVADAMAAFKGQWRRGSDV